MNNPGFKDVQLRIDVLPMRVPALQAFLPGKFVALTHCGGLVRHPAILDRWYVYRLPHRRGSDERIRAAYGKNHDRLVEVKTKWTGDCFG